MFDTLPGVILAVSILMIPLYHVAFLTLANNDICLVWSQLSELQTPPVVTTDFLYVRFIGDRSIQEKDFGRIQIDRIAEMQNWAENIKDVK